MIRTSFISEEALYNISPPQRTESYTPIDNRKIVDLIKNEAEKRNFFISASKFKANSDFKQVIGQFNIVSNNSDLGFMVAYRNSSDKSKSFGLALGAVVWICENGMISGEIITTRKHTGDADQEMSYKIIEGFSMMEDNFNSLIEAKKVLESVNIDHKVASELVGRMFMQHEIINTMQLNLLKKECEESQIFQTVYEPGFSAWDLYNNTTHVLKQSHPGNYISNHIKLHEFMMEEFK